MRRIVFFYRLSVPVIAVFCLFAAGAAPAAASALFGDEKPLAVVRLRTPDMAFNTILDRAIKAALNAKKDVTFTLAGAASPSDGLWQETLRTRMNELAARLRFEFGVPPERIHSVFDNSAGTARAEIRLYVD